MGQGRDRKPASTHGQGYPRQGNHGRKGLDLRGPLQLPLSRDMGVGKREEGGHFYLVTKEKSHNCFPLYSEPGGRLYLPEGLRSLWQPHIWAPESRCAASRSHSRTMRQILGSPAPAPTAGERIGDWRGDAQQGGGGKRTGLELGRREEGMGRTRTRTQEWKGSQTGVARTREVVSTRSRAGGEAMGKLRQGGKQM